MPLGAKYYDYSVASQKTKFNEISSIASIIYFYKCSENSNMMQEPFIWKLTLFWHCWRTIEVLLFKETLILPVLCHKSATMCQIDSNKDSNSKETDLWIYVKTRVLGHECFVWLFVYLALIPVSCFVVLFSVLFRFQLSVLRPNHSPSCSNTAPFRF